MRTSTKSRRKRVSILWLLLYPTRSLLNAQLILPEFSTIEIFLLVALLIPTVYTMVVGAPFVPTQMPQVDRMLAAANLKPGMKLYDLGSGDGRLVHKASQKYGAVAVGFEFSPLIWLWAKFLSLFWRSKAQLKYGNFWNQNLDDADVIVCYLLPHSMRRMQNELMPKLKPGTIVVSHAFEMPNSVPWKKLPGLRDQRLSPVWIYKKA